MNAKVRVTKSTVIKKRVQSSDPTGVWDDILSTTTFVPLVSC